MPRINRNIDIRMKKKLHSGRHFDLHAVSLRRVEDLLSGKKNPPRHMLDRLSLLAGFQSWHDLKEAIHGDADASLNYEEEATGKSK